MIDREQIEGWDRAPVETYGVTPEALTVYRNGRPAGRIPAEQFGALIYSLAKAMREASGLAPRQPGPAIPPPFPPRGRFLSPAP